MISVSDQTRKGWIQKVEGRREAARAPRRRRFASKSQRKSLSSPHSPSLRATRGGFFCYCFPPSSVRQIREPGGHSLILLLAVAGGSFSLQTVFFLPILESIGTSLSFLGGVSLSFLRGNDRD